MIGWFVPAAVAVVALLYVSVGHAGATGYIAVMGLAGVTPEVIRPTALLLNVVVAVIGTVQFARAGQFRRDLVVPLGLASVPAAALGGSLALPTAVFEAILGGVLAFSAVRIVLELWHTAQRDREDDPLAMRQLSLPMLIAIGSGLGFTSGLTGVGGGVFLTPLLLALRVAPTRQVAAVSVVFILVNSLAGLTGWLAAGRSLVAIDGWVVAAAVFGGLIGSQLGAFRLPVRTLRLLMALVLTVASVQLLGRAVAASPLWPGDVSHPPLPPGEPLPPAAGVDWKASPRGPLTRPPGFIGDRLYVSLVGQEREDALVVAMGLKPGVLATR